MQVFAQYLRQGDVVNNMRGRMVILNIKEPRREGRFNLIDCDVVLLDGIAQYHRDTVPLSLDSPYTVLSHIAEDRIARMKMPPPA